MPHDQAHVILISCVAAISGGVLLLVLCRKINIPGIVALVFGGVALGPHGLAIIDPTSLGHGLRVIVSLGIGIILFEGGLTLDTRGYSSASVIIRRLLTIGVLVTWLTTAAAIVVIYDATISLGLVAASLVIVTGPTVIGPLLRRINVNQKLRSVLHWEGVLIDPIGVFVAVLCFEWVATGSGPAAIGNFLLRVVLGATLGTIGGFAIYFIERKRFVPDNMLNVFALASAVLLYGVSEAALSEAGLLSVTIAGFILGVKKPVRLEQIKEFKAEITDLLVGTMFLLLTARLSFDQFSSFGEKGVWLVAFVMLVVRPLNIAVCTWGSQINFREKLFLSWIAPRGIVAASMASLFTLNDKLAGISPTPRFIETFVYSVIISTVVLQGFSAGWLAKILKLHSPKRNGWLIVGAHTLGCEIANFISSSSSSQTVLIDSNASAVSEAEKVGLTAILGDARSPDLHDLDELFELYSIGNLLALTDNEDLNTIVCQQWGQKLGLDHVFRWGRITTKAVEHDNSAGVLIWSDLPKPSLIADALAQGAISLYESNTYEDSAEEIRTPIISVREGEIIIDPPSVQSLDQSLLSQTLYLRQEVDLYDS